jgi:hypothetical protein
VKLASTAAASKLRIIMFSPLALTPAGPAPGILYRAGRGADSPERALTRGFSAAPVPARAGNVRFFRWYC